MSISLESQPKSSSLNDFVVIPQSNSFGQNGSGRKASQSSQELAAAAAAQNYASESRMEDNMLEKALAISRENEKLKETLKHNNLILQQYVKDFTEMQENHRANNEKVKREHQRAKEVVTKLRDDNRTLKEVLKAATLRISEEAKRERVSSLERENDFLKHQIYSLQEHITNIDKDLKDDEMSESTTESWRLLLGSLASYNFQTGIPPRNVESLASEMLSERHAHSNTDMQDRYTELQTENEILKVDMEKVAVEKQQAEEKLSELQGECNKLRVSFGHIREEKEELQKMLNEQCETSTKEQNDYQEMEKVCQCLQNEIQTLNEKLQHTNEKLAKSTEENERLSKAHDVEIQKNLRSPDATTYEDDEEHQMCREKYNAIQVLYFNLQKKENIMDDRENYLCDKEKELETEKQHIKQQIEKTRLLMAAELESHSESFLEKTNQLHSELEEAREREENLQQQVLQFHSEYSEEREREESLQDQVCQLIKENDAMRVKIDKLTELNSRRDTLYEERMKEREKQRREKEKENRNIIEMLQTQLGTSKEDRKKYQDQSALTKNECDRLACQHEQLIKEYDELLNSFNGTLEENRMRSSSSNAEIENYKAQMDDMAVHLTSAKESCIKKEHVISDLHDRLKMMEDTFNEQVPILKEQVSVYFNDFNAEREARQRNHAELDDLKEENQRLVQANAEMQMELDNMGNNQQMAEMQRRHVTPQQSNAFNPEGFRDGFHTRRGGEPEQREELEWPGQYHRPEPRVEQQQEEPFPCPGCRRNFFPFVELENHMRHCPEANQNVCPLCANEFPDHDTLEIHAQECGLPDA